jgi:tetratricopeptide (TPR) repeat protein
MSIRLRRQSTAPLPHLPLHFAAPLNVPGPGAEGAVLLAELSDAASMHLLRALRLVLAWCRTRAADGAAPGVPEVQRWGGTLRDADDAVPRDALRALAAALADGSESCAEAVAAACFAISEWAEDVDAEGTSLLFAQAAALAHPRCARSAWKAGRMLRDHGKTREAELWLRRAAKVAVWMGDAETQNLAINSLGNMYYRHGNYHEALRWLTRAAALARRLSAERRGAVTHDVAVVYITLGEFGRAEELAATALTLYGPGHPNLPRLAHDVALSWSQQGRFELVLPVMQEVLQHQLDEEMRLRALAAVARAAGTGGDRDTYEAAWAEAWTLSQRPGAHIRVVLAGALVDLGCGSASIGEWSRARMALLRAHATAVEMSEHDVVVRTEALLEMVDRYESGLEPAQAEAEPATSLAEALLHSMRRATTLAASRGR